MDTPKAFIESIRREKFSIGVGRNQLAPDLDRAIRQLSVGLYQHDFHFIKELIQNAEDNAYEENVCPSLEFKLIQNDIARVGASATLLILNNERGLTRADVTALCSVGDSTKVGRRNEGFIGCKGVGFKSIFMICETAIIISNGYRIKFRQTASKEAGVGYIVPEWTEFPSDTRIRLVCGSQKLPTTIIILPVRHGKVDLVRQELKELSPEMTLFLTRIRELVVADETEDAEDSVGFLKITCSKPSSGIKSNVCKFFEVTLGVERTAPCADPEKHSYIIFQQSFPVTHSIEERKEIDEWTVTLAFPKDGRASSGHVGDVFSFLPTELRTGFPFIIHADFLLTTSRETIRFDSPWNLGILDCVPAAYEVAFKILLRSNQIPQEITYTSTRVLDSKDAYEFLPYYAVDHSYRYNSAGGGGNRKLRQKLWVDAWQAANLDHLEQVRAEIFHRLDTYRVVLVSMDVGNELQKDTPPGHSSNDNHYAIAKGCRQVKPSFREILKTAAKSNHPAPSLVSKLSNGERSPSGKYFIVDEYIQEKYVDGLAALGVPEMTVAEYQTFLKDSQWLLDLPEKVYFQVLTFFAFEMKLFDQTASANRVRKRTFPLLKVRGSKGKEELATFDDINRRGVELFYTSRISAEKDAQWLAKWVDKFSECFSARVMPKATSRALREAKNSKELVAWMKKHASIEELSVQTYSERLIDKLMGGNVQPKHAILIVQFLYSAICEKFLSCDETVQSLRNLQRVSIVDHSGALRTLYRSESPMKTVLLPPKQSKWPLVFSLSPDYARIFIALSDMYLEPECSLADNIKTVTVHSYPGQHSNCSILDFIKLSFDAVDLPAVKVPADKHFPFIQPVTMEKSLLIMQWLKDFLPTRRTTKMENENDVFLQDLKALDWVTTFSHGWQRPTSVFCYDIFYEIHLTYHDLPFVDRPAYAPLDLIADVEAKFALEELGVVTNMRKVSASVAAYFSRHPAEVLDQKVMDRFYAYLSEVGFSNDKCDVKIWFPAKGPSFLPTWRAPTECVMRDEHDIFEDSSHVPVLDKVYNSDLLPFFSRVLHVPEEASVDLYCDI
ncbi:unnamed protein product [Calypogeia fissa]